MAQDGAKMRPHFAWRNICLNFLRAGPPPSVFSLNGPRWRQDAPAHMCEFTGVKPACVMKGRSQEGALMDARVQLEVSDKLP